MVVSAPIAASAIRVRVRGLVQGVGFRPHVYRLACDLGLTGWVRNDGAGVLIHAEGSPATLDCFSHQLTSDAPSAATIEAVESEVSEQHGATRFRILTTRQEDDGPGSVRVPADRAVCPACLAEVDDPADRRHAYPFTTCTDCGPRYSILARLPYDRPETGMVGFRLCKDCAEEYDDPECRRFHAETIACPACGPALLFRDLRSGAACAGPAAITSAAECLRAGSVLALKGVGGFQLLARADCSDAVRLLRRLKVRPSKPLALMVLSADEAEHIGRVGPAERRLLTSAENPIVLLDLLPGGNEALAPEVAPRLASVGVQLPTTPLHHLLLGQIEFPAICTSANRSDEPIISDAAALLAADLAGAVLTHNRPIVRRVDDSVLRVIDGRSVTVRLGRGLAPLPLPSLERWARKNRPGALPCLATGGHQKAAPALWTGTQAVLSAHVGDLDSAQTRRTFVETAGSLAELYGCSVASLACDLHPDYFSTRWAHEQGRPVVAVQHHHAHAVACMVEHDLLDREVLAFTWDGTGYGPDGTVWGGEVLRTHLNGFERVSSLRPFPLPGGEAAIRHPARVALGLLTQAIGPDAVLGDVVLLDRLGLTAGAAGTLLRAVERGVNSPWTSSVGRLFDGVAAMLLAVGETSSEGEAAGWLEAVADADVIDAYPLPLVSEVGGTARGDWRPLVRALHEDWRRGESCGRCAARFHNALAGWAAVVAATFPVHNVVLGGGCFQNALLTTRVRAAVEQLGRRVFGPGQVPPGDGGLAVGQLAVALATT